MSEPRLSPEAEKLIRGYIFKLVLPTGTLLAIVSFMLGFLIQYGAQNQAAKEAFQVATGELLKAVQDAERAKIDAHRLSVELQKIRNDAAKLQTNAALATAGRDVDAIAKAVARDSEFIKRVEAGAYTEVDVSVNNARTNSGRRPIFIVGFCNAASDSREIEARVGPNPERLSLVSSATGRDRINLAVVVPPGWFYNVRETTSVGVCNFRGWTI